MGTRVAVAGDLCVTPDPRVKKWTVVLCTTARDPKPLHTCDTKEAATAWAMGERERMRKETGAEPTVHSQEECPCFCNFPPPV